MRIKEGKAARYPELHFISDSKKNGNVRKALSICVAFRRFNSRFHLQVQLPAGARTLQQKTTVTHFLKHLHITVIIIISIINALRILTRSLGRTAARDQRIHQSAIGQSEEKCVYLTLKKGVSSFSAKVAAVTFQSFVGQTCFFTLRYTSHANTLVFQRRRGERLFIAAVT